MIPCNKCGASAQTKNGARGLKQVGRTRRSGERFERTYRCLDCGAISEMTGDVSSKEFSEETVALELMDGAVAVTDALGFRQAARTPEGAAGVVETVAATRRATSHETVLNNLAGEVHIHYAAVSDTIILAASTRGTLALCDTIASVAASVVSQIATAAGARLPLAYRGCLASGKLAVAEEDLIVGGAIDEAAEWYERAQAAIVWLTPAATAVISERRDEYGPLFVEFELPIRDLGTVGVTAINPFYVVARDDLIRWPGTPLNSPELVKWHDTLMVPLHRSDSLDVVLKRQNTAQFLTEARAQTEKLYPGWAKLKYDALANMTAKDEL